MSKYKNISKQMLAFTLVPDGDFIIHPGDTAELPENNMHVKALAAKGLLAETFEESKQKKFNPKKS